MEERVDRIILLVIRVKYFFFTIPRGTFIHNILD